MSRRSNTSRIRLRSGSSLAEMSCEGAELLQWDVAGQPLLWQPDEAVWAETAPILFPVVGWTRNGQIRIADQSYPLGLHGFARTKRFHVASLSDDAVRFVLESDAQTLALYPFAFRLSVDYRLEGTALSMSLNVANRGAGPMPYACGFHPGFRWPLSGDRQSGHHILFDEDEATLVPEITARGLFAPRMRPVPLQGARLELTPELLAREALCFLNVKSQGLNYAAGDGSVLRVETDDFPHLALWSRPPAPFLSIEIWTGHGDPDGFDGDFFTKPSMRILPPGWHASHHARFSFNHGSSQRAADLEREAKLHLAASPKSDTEDANQSQ